MLDKNKHTVIRSFDFAPDKIGVRLIGSRSSKMTDFEDLVNLFQQEFTDLHITLSEEAFNYEIFSFVIESDSYIKFKRIRKIFKFLEKNVGINDEIEELTDEVYF